ncbi:unnamed protein product [Alopecurus aequalis]
MYSVDEPNRSEPSWIRGNLLPHLELPADLPVHFIDERTVKASDLDARQSNFRLPISGVMHNLRPILTAKELQAANLQPEQRHGGRQPSLPVQVVDARAGIVELQMTTHGGVRTCLKGEGYMDFITECSFTVGDVVQIWAFKPRFGPLYLVMAKKPNQDPHSSMHE